MRDKMTSLEGKELPSQLLASLDQIPAEYFYIHGNILFKLKRNQEAHDQYIEAIKIDPQHGKAYNNLANLCYMVKKYKKSLHYLNLAEENGVQINSQLKRASIKALNQFNNSIKEESTPEGVKCFAVIVGTMPETFKENVYIVYNTKTGDAVIIDPGTRDERISMFIKSYRLSVKKILNSHGHYDHVGANRYYADFYGVKILAHEGDIHYYSEKNQKNKPDEFLSNEGAIKCGSLNVEIFHTPGHTPGSVCYLINGSLFSGDTLFKQSVGGTYGHSEEEKEKKMEQQIFSIKSKILVLHENTGIFPGHGRPTTIREEKALNPFLMSSYSQ